MVKLGRYEIEEDVYSILLKVKSLITNGKLGSIQKRAGEVCITCPCHSNGMEDTPSCYVNNEGVWYCFACHETGTLPKLIGECFDADEEFGRRWLLDRYVGDVLVDNGPSTLGEDPFQVKEKRYLDESVLNGLEPWHPYLEKRHLSKEVCSMFHVGYDPKCNMVVFPVWDEHGRLVMLTKRSVESKRFLIDKDAEKPVYLLNHIIRNGITEVIVCESQINCLTCYTWGKPAVAMFGTGTSMQYKTLRKSGIRHYILAFDGDEAGHKATRRFIANCPKDSWVDVVMIPDGKDVNDLTKEEFENLEILNEFDWIEKQSV